MNSQVAKLIVIRGPQGISTFNSGKLIGLVKRYKCETDGAEFKTTWDALCIDRYGQPGELIGITYADL